MTIPTRLDVLEAENERLREEVAELRELLYGGERPTPVEWRLTAAETRVMMALAARELATEAHVMSALYGLRPDGDTAEEKIVDVFICKIRKKVAPFGVRIETVWGRGWTLDAQTRARLRPARPGRAA
jgi:two-component system cell cycle response regulator CtrA